MTTTNGIVASTANISVAWAHFDEGRLHEAIQLTRQTLEQTPGDLPDGWAALGWFLLSAGSVAEAEAILASSLSIHPGHAPLHWYLGLVFLSQARPEEACHALSTAVRIDPNLDEAAVSLAWALGDLGKFEEATYYSRQALGKKVQPERKAQLGWLLLRQEKWEEATEQLAEALALKPEQEAARSNLATALRRLGRHNEALNVLSDGLTLSPEATDLQQQQIRLLLDLHRTEDARVATHRLLEQQPNEGMHWYLLSLVLVQRKRSGIAALALARARRLAPELPELWHQTGWMALAAGNLRTAGEAVERVLTLAPEDPRNDVLAAVVFEACGNLSAASEHAEKAVARDQGSAQAWRVLAQVRSSQERPGEAEKALHNALDLDPEGSGDTHRQLGWLFLTERRHEEAVAAFTAAADKNSQDASSWYGLAEAYRANGKFVEALQAIRNALHLRHDWQSALIMHGRLLIDNGSTFWNEAVVQLTEALSLEPTRGETRCHLSNVLHRLGRNDEALKVLADGLALSPDTPILQQQKIHLLLDLHHTKDARAECHRLLKQQPLEGMNWYLLALVQIQRKQHGVAARSLGRARRLTPELPEPWRQTGWLALQSGDLRTAREAVERVLALAPVDPTSDILAAVVLEASGNLSSASDHAEKAVTSAKLSAHAWRTLAQVRARQGHKDQAKEALHRALDLDPRNTSDTYRQLGWIFSGERQYEQAVAAFNAAVDNNPQDASSWYGLAAAYRADGKFIDALKAIRETLRLRDEWNDRSLRGQIIHEQVYYFLNRKWNGLNGSPQPHVIEPLHHHPISAETGHAISEVEIDLDASASVRVADRRYDYVVCSLSTQSHVPLLNTLAKSVRRHFSGRIYLLIVDSDDTSLIPEGTTLVRLNEVIETSVWQEMVGRYNILELCCALKSYLMRFLARTVGCPIFYLDADTYLLAPLDSLLPKDPDFSVFLTPHLPSSLPGDCHAEEIGMLSVGAYNGGMVGIGIDDDGIRFLDWWLDRVTRYAYDSREQGVFTDQKWLDLVPCFFRNVHICRDIGLNVGHWRVCSERDFDEDSAGRLMFRGEAVTHMHMSGFKPNRPDLLAQHLRPQVMQNSPLGKFLQRYALEVTQNTP